MGKKILVISTSPRKGGNSESLADAFVDGATQAGNDVEKICLYDKTINFCKGCMGCLKTNRCVIHDDADMIAQKMRYVDVVVFATPIYYYEMSGQMKVMLDRANPLYGSNYQFKDVYLLASAAEDDSRAIDGAINGLSGWVECFPNCSLKGSVLAGGVEAIGDIHDHPALLTAFNLGKNA